MVQLDQELFLSTAFFLCPLMAPAQVQTQRMSHWCVLIDPSQCCGREANPQATRHTRDEPCVGHRGEKHETEPFSPRPGWVSGHEDRGAPGHRAVLRVPAQHWARRNESWHSFQSGLPEAATLEGDLKNRKGRGGSPWFFFNSGGRERLLLAQQSRQSN